MPDTTPSGEDAVAPASETTGAVEAHISSVAEYFTALSEIAVEDSQPWYRGMIRSDWPLLPSLYRESVPAGYDGRRKLEMELLSQFIARSGPFVDSPVFGSQTFSPQAGSGMKWSHYVAMQHYGLPTRLLDWTENALIALYFALYPQRTSRCPVCAKEVGKCADCVSAQTEHPGGVVWVLNPGLLNDQASLSNHGAVRLEDHTTNYEVGSNAMNPAPAAVIAQISNPRILAQRGMFTIHGEKEEGLKELVEKSSNPELILTSVLIAPGAENALRDELDRIGLMESMVFPDLPSVCVDIRRRVLG